MTKIMNSASPLLDSSTTGATKTAVRKFASCLLTSASNVIWAKGVEDQRDGRSHREAPDEHGQYVTQRLALVEVDGPDKEQVDEGLQDPEPDERSAQFHGDTPLESDIARI